VVSLSVKIKGERDAVLRKALYVASQSILDVLEHAQRTQPSVQQTGGSFEIGKIPVLSSELVNSLSVEGQIGPNAYAGPIAAYRLGGMLNFRWTAPHAAPIEYGFTKGQTSVAGRLYVTTAVGKFASFAKARAREVQ
jgi:hypothetical protein